MEKTKFAAALLLTAVFVLPARGAPTEKAQTPAAVSKSDKRTGQGLRAWFDGSLLGQDVLLAQIGQKIFAVDGVANYQIQGPVNDVTVGRGQLPVLGKLSVEELR